MDESQTNKGLESKPKKNIALNITIIIIFVILIVLGFLFYDYKTDNGGTNIYVHKNTEYNKYPNVSDFDKNPIVSNSAGDGKCKNVELKGNTKIEMVRYWLENSGCFPEEYVDQNISNIREDENISGYVYYDVISNGEKINSNGWSGRFYLIQTDGKYTVNNIYGPLKPYTVNFSRQQVADKLKGNGFIKSGADIAKSLELINNDEYSTENGFKYEASGLQWVAQTKACELMLHMDAMSGEVFERKTICVS